MPVNVLGDLSVKQKTSSQTLSCDGCVENIARVQYQTYVLLYSNYFK
jgi:hypothetical protein